MQNKTNRMEGNRMTTLKTTIRLPIDCYDWLSKFSSRSGKIVRLVRDAIAKEKQLEATKIIQPQPRPKTDSGINLDLALDWMNQKFRGKE